MNRDVIRTRAFAEHEPGTTDIGATAKAAMNWLFSDVLPLWAVVGHDRAHGGFFEQIGFEGAAIKIPKRCRVQARQVYVFVEAGRIGWNGSWRALANNGLDFMLEHHLRPDGLMRFKTELDGAPYDDRVDNYDQAFAIFALAHAYSVNRDRRFPIVALAILAALRRERAHPLGGFFEAIPGRAALLSNPHMHLFEAALAWLDVAPRKEWRELAQEIGVLCQTDSSTARLGRCENISRTNGSPVLGKTAKLSSPAISSNGLGCLPAGAIMAGMLIFPLFAVSMPPRTLMALIGRGPLPLGNYGWTALSRTLAHGCGRKRSA